MGLLPRWRASLVHLAQSLFRKQAAVCFVLQGCRHANNRNADSPTSSSEYPSNAMNSMACLLPTVIVPVLSKRTTSASPAVSIALPDLPRFYFGKVGLWRPMAGNKAPMVVGRRQTYNAINTDKSAPRPRVTDVPSNARMIMVNMAVKPIKTMVIATSLGVFGRLADSTILIIWSMKVSRVSCNLRCQSVAGETRASD